VNDFIPPSQWLTENLRWVTPIRTFFFFLGRMTGKWDWVSQSGLLAGVKDRWEKHCMKVALRLAWPSWYLVWAGGGSNNNNGDTGLVLTQPLRSSSFQVFFVFAFSFFFFIFETGSHYVAQVLFKLVTSCLCLQVVALQCMPLCLAVQAFLNNLFTLSPSITLFMYLPPQCADSYLVIQPFTYVYIISYFLCYCNYSAEHNVLINIYCPVTIQ
jgi:hypothetical protein